MSKTKQPGVLFVLFLVLVMGALLWLFDAAEDYFSFAARTIQSASEVAPLNKESILANRNRPAEKFDTEVKYRTFFLTAPGAQKVELIADFNRWGKDPVVLRGYKKGYFETSVALVRGQYRYAFLVDGQRTLDPTNMDRQVYEGQQVCLKTVR